MITKFKTVVMISSLCIFFALASVCYGSQVPVESGTAENVLAQPPVAELNPHLQQTITASTHISEELMNEMASMARRISCLNDLGVVTNQGEQEALFAVMRIIEDPYCCIEQTPMSEEHASCLEKKIDQMQSLYTMVKTIYGHTGLLERTTCLAQSTSDSNASCDTPVVSGESTADKVQRLAVSVRCHINNAFELYNEKIPDSLEATRQCGPDCIATANDYTTELIAIFNSDTQCYVDHIASLIFSVDAVAPCWNSTSADLMNMVAPECVGQLPALPAPPPSCQ